MPSQARGIGAIPGPAHVHTDTATPPGWTFVAGDEIDPSLVVWARLGGGRRCETWLCWSRELFAPVAVKLGRPSTATEPATASRLELEARNVRALAHPAFQHLYASRTGAGVPHLVFEYVEGPSLKSLIVEHGAFELADVIAIGEQVAWALAHLHGRGLVHLDLKPGNMLLRDGRPVIVDLGLARPIGTRARTRLRGTVGYHAPEQLAGDVAAATMDMYTLGIVLCELVLGHRRVDSGPVSGGVMGSAGFDELVHDLLGDVGSRPAAVDVAVRLGDLAAAMGQERYRQI